MNKNSIRKLCNSDHPILFEIGCAEGLDTEDFVRTFVDLDFKLYCFEPYEQNAIEFKNVIKDTRVKFYQVAIGNVDGEVDFNISLGKNIYSSSLREPGEAMFKTWANLFPNRYSFGKTTVKSVRLDTFVEDNHIKLIDFIWMDVQGAEDLVIEGGRKTFDKKVRYLYTEYSNQEIYVGEPSLKKILKMLPNYSVIENFPNKTGDKKGGDVLLKNNVFI